MRVVLFFAGDGGGVWVLFLCELAGDEKVWEAGGGKEVRVRGRGGGRVRVAYFHTGLLVISSIQRI